MENKEVKSINSTSYITFILEVNDKNEKSIFDKGNPSLNEEGKNDTETMEEKLMLLQKTLNEKYQNYVFSVIYDKALYDEGIAIEVETSKKKIDISTLKDSIEFLCEEKLKELFGDDIEVNVKLYSIEFYCCGYTMFTF